MSEIGHGFVEFCKRILRRNTNTQKKKIEYHKTISISWSIMRQSHKLISWNALHRQTHRLIGNSECVCDSEYDGRKRNEMKRWHHNTLPQVSLYLFANTFIPRYSVVFFLLIFKLWFKPCMMPNEWDDDDRNKTHGFYVVERVYSFRPTLICNMRNKIMERQAKSIKHSSFWPFQYFIFTFFSFFFLSSLLKLLLLITLQHTDMWNYDFSSPYISLCYCKWSMQI